MTARLFGSLFSGIGGLDVALAESGWTPAWQVENDPFCTKVLERHWPNVTRYGDIREIGWTGAEHVELICGGFPCQPFSVAGQNRGVDDERNMWPETYRAVRELGPRYVFLENVPGILAHKYFGRILGDLAEGGYDAVWDTFTAAEVGAPHRRERLFILAYAAIDIRRAPRDDRREPSDGAGDRDVAESPTIRHGAGGQQNGSGRQTRRLASNDTSMAHALSSATNGASIREHDGTEREAVGRGLHALADTAGSRQRTGLRDDDARQPDALGSFPPGPDDRDAWAQVLAEVPALEPAVCRSTSRISAWLDCIDWDEAHKLVLAYANASQAQPPEVLHDLWDAHGTSGQDDWSPRRFSDIRSEEILFAFLRQLEANHWEGRTSLESAATSEGCLRSLWMDQIVTCPSCGWRPNARRPREHSDALRTLSRLLAQHAQAAWARAAESDALAHRTHRLRALGNAVVPTQGAHAFRTLWQRMIAL